MNKYRISTEMRPNIEKVLRRRVVSYKIKDGYISTKLDRRDFHKVVLRAKCEYLTEKNELPDGIAYYIPKIEEFRDVESELGKTLALCPCPTK